MLEGGCTCREVRYRLTRQPMFVHCCHCRWCQRETGSAFAINAIIEENCLQLLSGAPQARRIPSQSGNGQIVTRCPSCQTALWSNYSGAGSALHFVRVGTLDEPDRAPPDIHIYTSSKQPWIVLPPHCPAVFEYYDREAIWPAASLKRRNAALADR